MKKVDENNNEQVGNENKRERDVSEIDWSGLGDVVMKRYFARLKKDGLLPPYLEKYLVEEDENTKQVLESRLANLPNLSVPPSLPNLRV